MHRDVFIGLFVLLALPLAAAESPDVSGAADRLMEAARKPEADFFAAYDEARDAGVPEAKLVQARLMKGLVAGDLRGLLGMLDKIEQYSDGFDTGFDPGGEKQFPFVDAIEVDGLVETLKAVKAFQDDDEAAFEQHAKAAYWTWPRWAQTFQLEKLIAQKRFREITRKHVANLTLPLDLPLRDLDDHPLTLGEVVAGQKAVLFDFWASWCGPCIRAMPELQKRADTLPAQGVGVVAVNTDDENPLEKARKVKDEHQMNMTWLVEAEKQPLSARLFIDSIPRAVLVAADGRVLFSGHPADEELSAVLRKLGADESRPPPLPLDVKGASGLPKTSLLD